MDKQVETGRVDQESPPADVGDVTGETVSIIRAGARSVRGTEVTMRQAGAAGYRQMIADDIALSRAMAAAIERHPELELMTQSLSITTFRYVPPDTTRLSAADAETYLHALNSQLLEALQSGGELFVSNAVIRGRYALRACIVNFHTSAADVEAVPGIVVRAGRALDAAMRA